MATVKNLKLDEITLEYNSFVDSQVLTAKQLNDIVEFFEDQQRLTRTCLIGVGLVCGLSVKGNANGITISKGCGVTTDGDLLYVPETTFKNFKAYDNSLIKYPPFYPLGTDSSQMLLWELLPDATSTAPLPVDAKSLGQFKTTANKEVSDMVALLYLEYFEKEPDACTAIDCDNQGKKQVAKPKVLLLTREDMEQIITRTNSEIVADDLFKKYYDAYTAYFDLPVIGVRRVTINSLNNSSSSQLANAYTTTAKNGAAGLAGAIEKLYQTFGFILDQGNQFNIISTINTLSSTFGQTIDPTRAQYFYDFYKDLATAYNELRAVLSDIIYQCCPDIYSFPKHIMLGALNTTATPKPTAYRHIFYPSPVVSKNKISLSKAQTMMERLFMLISNFDVPNSASPVKITPSSDYNQKLQNRAIPFYYNNTSAIASKWNFEKTKQGLDRQILSYRSADYAGTNDLVINPLNYSIDSNDFFRIEGHMGKNHQEAMSLVDTLRKQYNLPFDLIAIRLGAAQLEDIDLEDYACQFDDLEAVLKAWQAEQNCLYGSISKFFSTFNAGTGTKTHHETLLNTLTETSRASAVKPEAKEETVTFKTFSSISKVSAGTTAYMKSGAEVIDNNLFKEKDSIGQYFDIIIKEGKTNSIADIIEEAKKKIDTTMLSSDDTDVVVNIPLRIIAGTRKLSEWMPERLTDIDASMLTTYKTNLDNLCNEVKAAQKKTRTVFTKQGYIAKGYEQDYEQILWQLSENCCADEKLEVFREEIQKRKENILKQLTFANYLASHPGIEHKAGVRAGGTFILVYAPTNTRGAVGIITIEELINDPVFIEGFKSEEEMVEYFGMHLESNDVAEALGLYQKSIGRKFTPYELVLFERRIQAYIDARRAGVFGKKGQSSASNIVVADFCLPYMCCSDCPPVAFIMPQPKVSLSLPKAVSCSDEAPLLFHADPADGTIKASEGFEKTIMKKDDGTYFDPSQIADGQFGKPITFTLNDQLTDCTITIIKHPEITPSSTQKVNEKELLVSLNATTNQKSGDTFTYTWALGDGRVQSGLTEPKLDVSYLLNDLRKNYPDGKLSLSLTATNQNCSNTQQLVISFEIPVEQPELKLAAESVCSDAGPVAFVTVKPDAGIVASKTAGDRVRKVNGQWIFDPSAGPFNNKINDFTVNDQVIPDCVITVFEHPYPTFTYKLETDLKKQVVIIQFENTTPNQDSFSFLWDLNKEDKSEEINPKMVVEMANYPRGKTVNIRLIATNKRNTDCRGTSATMTISLQGSDQVIPKDKFDLTDSLLNPSRRAEEVKKVTDEKKDDGKKLVKEDPAEDIKKIKVDPAAEKLTAKELKVTKTKISGKGTTDKDSDPK